MFVPQCQRQGFEFVALLCLDNEFECLNPHIGIGVIKHGIGQGVQLTVRQVHFYKFSQPVSPVQVAGAAQFLIQVAVTVLFGHISGRILCHLFHMA